MQATKIIVKVTNVRDPISMDLLTDIPRKRLFKYRKGTCWYACDAASLAVYMHKSGNTRDPFTNVPFTMHELGDLDQQTSYDFLLVLSERLGLMKHKRECHEEHANLVAAVVECMHEIESRIVESVHVIAASEISHDDSLANLMFQRVWVSLHELAYIYQQSTGLEEDLRTHLRTFLETLEGTHNYTCETSVRLLTTMLTVQSIIGAIITTPA